MHTVVFLVLSSLCLLAVQAHYVTRTVTDTPCSPGRYARSCGEYKLLGEVSTPLTEGYGPNVCRITKTYEVQTLLYVTANFCNRRRCRSFCASTRNCSGPVRNVTTAKVACCDGFAVAPANDSAVVQASHWRSRRKSRVLRDRGCTLMLRESVTDCLLELNMDTFTLQLLTESPNTADELGNDDGTGTFTVFGVPDARMNSSVATLGHVVNRTVEGKFLSDRAFQTLMANVCLHTVKGKQTKTVFVNGKEVDRLNACQARNGIVHVMKCPIPQSNMTIAERLRGDPRFTSFLRLLDAANLTSFLDVKRKSRTVLAPTNDAFSKLSENAVECLLRPENSKYISQLVLIHISSPAEYTATLSQCSRLYTFNRRYYLFVQVEDGDILISNSRIPLEEGDIPANNGVIHALSEVVVPPEVDFEKMNCETDGAVTTEAVSGA